MKNKTEEEIKTILFAEWVKKHGPNVDSKPNELDLIRAAVQLNKSLRPEHKINFKCENL